MGKHRCSARMTPPILEGPGDAPPAATPPGGLHHDRRPAPAPFPQDLLAPGRRRRPRTGGTAPPGRAAQLGRRRAGLPVLRGSRDRLNGAPPKASSGASDVVWSGTPRPSGGPPWNGVCPSGPSCARSCSSRPPPSTAARPGWPGPRTSGTCAGSPAAAPRERTRQQPGQQTNEVAPIRHGKIPVKHRTFAAQRESLRARADL